MGLLVRSGHALPDGPIGVLTKHNWALFGCDYFEAEQGGAGRAEA